MMGARSLAALKDATRFYRSHQASWQRQRQLSVVGWQLSAAEDRSTAIFHGRRRVDSYPTSQTKSRTRTSSSTIIYQGNAQIGKRCSRIVAMLTGRVAKIRSGLGRFFAPKGLQDLARGFNQVSTPGNVHPRRLALKGRKIEREPMSNPPKRRRRVSRRRWLVRRITINRTIG